MPNLIRDNAFVDDSFTHIEDGEPLPTGDAIISITRLLAEAESLRARNHPIGVVVRAGSKEGEDIRALAPYLDMISLISIEFPVYRNGRGFSNARILREEFGFKGEIRATGEVLFDQIQFMLRCGIDAFEVADDFTLEDFRAAVGSLTDAYQPAADDEAGVIWRRHARP